MIPDNHFMTRHSTGIQIAPQFPVHITLIYWVPDNTRCHLMSAPHMMWGDHCSVPGTCPRQTVATSTQVFSVGSQGFLQARSDHTDLRMVGLVWRWQAGPSYLGMLKSLSRPDWAPGPRAEEGNSWDKRHRYYVLPSIMMQTSCWAHTLLSCRQHFGLWKCTESCSNKTRCGQ